MEFLSLKDHVYNFIAEQIRLGKLNSNEKVNEQDICQQLNISRTPVREALIQLAADGFLDSAPRRGFRVKPLTKKEGEDIYHILAPLDALAAEVHGRFGGAHGFSHRPIPIRRILRPAGALPRHLYRKVQ